MKFAKIVALLVLAASVASPAFACKDKSGADKKASAKQTTATSGARNAAPAVVKDEKAPRTTRVQR